MVTKEELLNIRPPNDVIAELKEIEEKSGMSHDRIRAAWATIITLSELDIFTNLDDRCRQASKIMIAQLESKQSGGGGTTYLMEFAIIDMTSISQFEKEKKTVQVNKATNEAMAVSEKETIPTATVYGIFSSPSEVLEPNAPAFTPKLGVLRLWDDAVRILQLLEKGKTYRIRCSISTGVDDYYKLNLNTYEEPVQVNVEVPPIKDLIVRLFESFSVAEASYHQGQLKLMHCRIKTGRTGLNKKSKMQGNMTVSDVNVAYGTNNNGTRKDLNITWWNAPEFAVKYAPGSEIYVMCDLADKGDNYGLSGTGHFIVPILGLPQTINVFDTPETPINATPTPSEPIASVPLPPVPIVPPATTPAPNTAQNLAAKPTSPAAISNW